jgi:sugar/nucleoside kinase (ribokinase family)
VAVAAPFDLLVLGDLNPDIVLSGEVEPVFGQAERLVERAHVTMGGSGGIVACGTARLGLKVAMCGVVGDDLFGRWIRKDLDSRGIVTDGIIVDPELPTGLTVVLSRRHDRAILTHPGTITELRAELLDPRLLSETRHIQVSSYFLQRRLAPDLPSLFDEAHRLGVTTSLDPNWDPSEGWDGGLHDVLARTDVFLPNGVEAMRIAGEDAIERAVARLARSAGLVVAKLGKEGAIAAEGTNLVRAPGLQVDPTDTTGAGDSFDAGFLASWLAGDPLERAMAIGNACGALSTRALGGVDGQPTMEEALDAITRAGLWAG